eukprot:COSAG04_NODE_8471_length_970_cov_1.367394_2_plen_79_part_00
MKAIKALSITVGTMYMKTIKSMTATVGHIGELRNVSMSKAPSVPSPVRHRQCFDGQIRDGGYLHMMLYTATVLYIGLS